MKVREMAQVIVRLKPETKARLLSKAKSEERSQNWLISKIIEEALDRDEQLQQA